MLPLLLEEGRVETACRARAAGGNLSEVPNAILRGRRKQGRKSVLAMVSGSLTAQAEVLGEGRGAPGRGGRCHGVLPPPRKLLVQSQASFCFIGLGGRLMHPVPSTLCQPQPPSPDHTLALLASPQFLNLAQRTRPQDVCTGCDRVWNALPSCPLP